MNISLSEIMVVLLVALLVIKPEQLPEVAQTVGKFIRMIRNLVSNVKEEMNGLIDSVDDPKERKREQ